jgi:phosphopantetheinyl transferase (holo-ACP synthase)
VTELSKQQKKKIFLSKYFAVKNLFEKAKSCKEEENLELRDCPSFKATHFM